MGTTVWIGAHPDDEIFVAPLLGELCVERGQVCTIISATHGEAGVCLLSGGCHPDLATVREQEFRLAANLLRATPVIGAFRDGTATDPEEVLRTWAEQAGGPDRLEQVVIDEIRRSGARYVLTFDPRHGSSCHPDHRAIGTLVMRTIERMGAEAPMLFFVETKVVFSAIRRLPRTNGNRAGGFEGDPFSCRSVGNTIS